MKKLFFALLAFALLIFGCAQNEGAPLAATPSPQTAQAASPIAPASTAATEAAENGVGDGAQFETWTAPDGSVTLQVPVGWTASERQVDTCTVNWAVTSPSGTGQAFMTNQILVFKSEAAKQMYQAYGTAGIDAAPISSFLGAEQAVAQVIAPLSGSSNVQLVYRDAAMTQQFSQAVCAAGLAACDAQVFIATYSYNGVPMKGVYFAQSLDLGDGGTWWINLWGYTSSAAEWDGLSATLEKTFSSVQYEKAWADKCSKGASETSDLINGVIERRQQSSDTIAKGWDDYIRGE